MHSGVTRFLAVFGDAPNAELNVAVGAAPLIYAGGGCVTGNVSELPGFPGRALGCFPYSVGGIGSGDMYPLLGAGPTAEKFGAGLVVPSAPTPRKFGALSGSCPGSLGSGHGEVACASCLFRFIFESCTGI